MPVKNIEERKLELEHERLTIETRLKEAELEFQKEQLNTKSKGFFAWAQTPIGAAVIVGLLGLCGTIYNGYQSNQIEKRKQESNLILEAIKTSGTGKEKKQQTAANLLFLAKAGLIELSTEKLKELETEAGENMLPSLPAPQSANIDDVPTTVLTEDLLIRDATSGDGKSSPQNVGKDEASRYDHIRKSVESRNYTLDTTSGYINIVGLRQLDNVDKYDDVIFLVWIDSNGKHVKEFRASCDPGEYRTLNPINPNGTANLKDGQYDYQIGMARVGSPDQYKALRPISEQTVWRDTNKNLKFDDGDIVETGHFGLLIMPGGTSKEVGGAPGTQLIYGGRDSDQWITFFKTVESSSSYQKIYRYTLITVPKGQANSSK